MITVILKTEAGTILEEYTIPDDGRNTYDVIQGIISLSKLIDNSQENLK